MKKLTLFFSIIFLLSIFYNAKTQVKTIPANSGKTQVELLSSTGNETAINFKPGEFTKTSVNTPKGEAFIISIDKGTSILQKGAPDLPKFTTSIIIPDKAEMKVEVVSSNYTEIDNIEIAPSKGNLLRTVDPATVPYEYGEVYSVDAYFPSEIAELREPYILRDFRGQTVIVYPFQYNPVQKKLRVYTDITVKITPTGNIGINPYYRTKDITVLQEEFKKIYAHHFINFKKDKYTPLEEQGNMLIICYGQFMSAMQAFVNWKIQKGIPTEIVNVASIGGATAIKNYVANYYNTKGLTFLLLVGDAAQVPTYPATSGDSDNSYGYIVGGDSYIDIFVGRFSAETVAQVNTQVERTIFYELTPDLGDWYKIGMGIASNEGPGDDNEMDYEHIRNIRTQLLGYSYTSVSELYDGSQGGQDAPGDPAPSDVSAILNNTICGIINYCGHGLDNSWVTTAFSNSDVDNLTNHNKLPFIWSVACVNGNFVGQTCFAEAWLRSTDNNQPTGAIAVFMSTINQSWSPPMEAHDEMNAILVESYTNNIKRTYGGLSMNGIFKMNDTYADYDMADTWTIFGDPSLMVRTDIPTAMTVTHAPQIPLGSNNLDVFCDTEGALICLTLNGAILGTGYISEGSVNITFPPVTQVDTITVTATAYNKIPYVGQVLIIPSVGAYIIKDSHLINDPTGDNQHDADYGESVTLNVTLKNIGSENASGVYATLSTTDANVTITDNTQLFGNIDTINPVTQNDAYAFTIANCITDQHVVNFDLEIIDANDSVWHSSINITLNAPILAISDIIIDDSQNGNNNGVLDAGDTVTLLIPVVNTGHQKSLPATGLLSTTSQYITLSNNTATLGIINASDIAYAIFNNVIVSNTAPNGAVVNFTFAVNAGGCYDVAQTFSCVVGHAIEDFETGDFTKFAWTSGGNLPWIIDSVNPYEGTYCARSGAIGDNQTSELMITLNVLSADTIYFYKKVSCEACFDNYGYWCDYLEFSIDGVSQQSWDGEHNWSLEKFPVSAGQHTFKWVYVKDDGESAGQDAVWIDYILFPPIYISTNVQEASEQPATFVLFNYPNPFSSQTMINYILNEPSSVTLEVYDVQGKLVATLIDGQKQAKGFHYVTFNSSHLTAGVYYCRLQTEKQVAVQKLKVVKP